MRKQKSYIRAVDLHRQSKKEQNSLDSTFDVSNKGVKRFLEPSKRAAIKISLRVPKLDEKIEETSQKPVQESLQFNTDEQLLQILKMSAEVSKNNPFNDIIKSHTPKIEKSEEKGVLEKLHKLFDLYIKEEILKHYCLKSGWKIQKTYLDKIVLPTFDLLAISKDKVTTMFQPFLKQLTSKFLLQTQLDTYSRLRPVSLLMEISEIWIRIKQAEIEAKRSIRSSLTTFIMNFCKRSQGKLLIERTALFNAMFTGSKQIRMVSLIKIFIFCFKSQGENNQQSFQDWLQQY